MFDHFFHILNPSSFLFKKKKKTTTVETTVTLKTRGKLWARTMSGTPQLTTVDVNENSSNVSASTLLYPGEVPKHDTDGYFTTNFNNNLSPISSAVKDLNNTNQKYFNDTAAVINIDSDGKYSNKMNSIYFENTHFDWVSNPLQFDKYNYIYFVKLKNY